MYKLSGEYEASWGRKTIHLCLIETSSRSTDLNATTNLLGDGSEPPTNLSRPALHDSKNFLRDTMNPILPSIRSLTDLAPQTSDLSPAKTFMLALPGIMEG